MELYWLEFRNFVGFKGFDSLPVLVDWYGFGNNVEGFICDTRIIINELTEALSSLSTIVNLYKSDNMYIGTANDQIRIFINSLYMQISKLQEFYELGEKYMENTRSEFERTIQHVESIVSSINIAPMSRGVK